MTKAKGWAAVALAAISCLVQGINFVRSDLKPLIETLQQNTAAMKRIEQKLEDHERRITALERKK